MWLLPPDFPQRPLRLAPDCRALPWYANDHEIEQLMELLRRMVPEIREWVRVPWGSLERVSSRHGLRAGAALVLDAPEIDEVEARACAGQAGWPYVFWRPTQPSEQQDTWIEREVKRALISELRQGLASAEHPLHEQGISRLPVDLVAASTDDPVELMAIVQGAVTHRLERAEEGLRSEDWEYSVRRATGERLAARLGRVEEEKLEGVLELILSEGERPLEAAKKDEAGQRLQSTGLGLWVGESLALGPLARRVSDPVVYGVLLERLPTKRWPVEQNGRGFLRPASYEHGTTLSLPAIRMAGPSLLFMPKLVVEALDELEERAKSLLPQSVHPQPVHPQPVHPQPVRPLAVHPKSLSAGREAAVGILKQVRLVPVMRNEGNAEMIRASEEELGKNLRLLDQIRPRVEAHRELVELLRVLVEPNIRDPPADIESFLSRVERLAQPLDDNDRWRVALSARIKLLATALLVYLCQDQGWLRVLGGVVDAEHERWRSEHARASDDSKRMERYWSALRAETNRLEGRSALAARRYQQALFLFSDIMPQDQLHFGLVRARREAGYGAVAFSDLERLSQSPLNDRSFDASIRLELAHVELERGSIAKARRFYGEARERGEGTLRTSLYAEAHDMATQLIEGTTSDFEPRLQELRATASELSDDRLSMLVELVLGDTMMHTDRFDEARSHYELAQGYGVHLGDQLAIACALERIGYLELRLGRKEAALSTLVEGARLDSWTEHYGAAERQMRRASELAKQLANPARAQALAAKAAALRQAAETHEIDIFEHSKRIEDLQAGSAGAEQPFRTEDRDPSPTE